MKLKLGGQLVVVLVLTIPNLRCLLSGTGTSPAGPVLAIPLASYSFKVNCIFSKASNKQKSTRSGTDTHPEVVLMLK